MVARSLEGEDVEGDGKPRRALFHFATFLDAYCVVGSGDTETSFKVGVEVRIRQRFLSNHQLLRVSLQLRKGLTPFLMFLCLHNRKSGKTPPNHSTYLTSENGWTL